ncbi:hypothetical protein PN466_02215 [Roseofilum reptotaenium CS-1145]|uniref:Uncharacterized protein n=1 Tax=Roseofilum reptotaenium AO1-A TaxID=1925591 RepID=A0A1L9QPV7_9CYAN|nr:MULTISPECIES: hypothetical protein [Roseofilum]MBP0030308.1 hypothetical protein [Roseofilum sp. Guam]MDB9515772.1 hypothetical protein [Roseofilum reptotaenium CS-1145]OJJ24627.1 hypothetical protein BI308_15860 [Roseofilum reptotaenium AO1-A]
MKTIELKNHFDELDFLEFFLVEPKVAHPEDGYWCYEVSDSVGSTLKFGIDIIQSSVQIEIKKSDAILTLLSFEAIEKIEIDGSGKKLSFCLPTEKSNIKTQIKVEISPQIKVFGHSLKIQ